MLAALTVAAQAKLVGPDYYKTLTAEAAATSEALRVSVTTSLNGAPEPARILVFNQKGGKLAEKDAAKENPAVFKLARGADYRIEASFPRLTNSRSVAISKLSRDLAVSINLEYYHVLVRSRRNGADDYRAAATVRVYTQRDQAHPLNTGHTDGYSPTDFFLEAHKRYVFAIRYDDAEISANLNGKLLYDLSKDTALTFDY